jgi:hypothetical protein
MNSPRPTLAGRSTATTSDAFSVKRESGEEGLSAAD